MVYPFYGQLSTPHPPQDPQKAYVFKSEQDDAATPVINAYSSTALHDTSTPFSRWGKSSSGELKQPSGHSLQLIITSDSSFHSGGMSYNGLRALSAVTLGVDVGNLVEGCNVGLFDICAVGTELGGKVGGILGPDVGDEVAVLSLGWKLGTKLGESLGMALTIMGIEDGSWVNGAAVGVRLGASLGTLLIKGAVVGAGSCREIEYPELVMTQFDAPHPPQYPFAAFSWSVLHVP